MKDYWNSSSYPIDNFAPLSQPFNRPPSTGLSSSISEAQRDYSSHSFMELSSPSFFNTDSFVSASSRTADPSSASFSSSRENTNEVTNGFSQSQVLSNSTSSPLKLSSSIPAPSFFPHQVSSFSTATRPETESGEAVPHATTSLRQYAAVREFVPTPSSSTPTSSTELSHEPPPEPATTAQPTNYEYAAHRKGASSGERASSNNAGTKRGRRQNGRITEPSSQLLTIDIANLQKDKRTTLMIRNIPNSFSQEVLLKIVNGYIPNRFDFFYLPIDFRTQCNLGYCYINVIDVNTVEELYRSFHNKHWPNTPSQKTCQICYARIQGTDQMLEHSKDWAVMHLSEQFRPLFYKPVRQIVGGKETIVMQPVTPDVEMRMK